MKQIKRIKEIIKILNEHGSATTEYLSNIFDVSESTIRRDLQFMSSSEDYPYVKRIFGGVILVKNEIGLEYMFDLKLNLNSEIKKAIAKKVPEYIEDGDSIVIDSGTTCLYAAKQIHHRKGIKVLTTDIKVAEELGRHSDIESIVIGGLIRAGYYTLVGDIALDNLNHLNINKTFMSADAVDIHKGITNAGLFEVGIKKKIIEIAQKVILIVDYTKFNKYMMYKVADLSSIDCIITNKELDSEYADRIKDTGAKLVLV